MITPRTLTLNAPAKLNLFLHITGKRADGVHLLQSLVCFLGIHDTIAIAPHDSFYIDCDGPFGHTLSDPRENIVYKAAKALAETFQMPLRARIHLIKNIPVGGGLGGGSTDAAMVLKGLTKTWGLPEDQERLHAIAEKIGADVPACLHQKTVWVEGGGEKVTRLSDMPKIHFVLVNPMVFVPTAEVYRLHDTHFSRPIQFSGRRKTFEEWLADLKIYRNDLTDAALMVSPDIRRALDALKATAGCLLHRISGSGATCFGIYNSKEAAHLAAYTLKNRYPDWWIEETTSI